MTTKLIDLEPVGGSIYNINVSNTALLLEIKYNYFEECWLMDIYDSLENLIIGGVMLVPQIDLLRAFDRIKEDIGTFVLYEQNEDDYRDSMGLGIKTKLVWYSSSDEITSYTI